MHDQGEVFEAIKIFVKPVYEKFNKGESLADFAERFMNSGGKINLEIPEWLMTRMREENNEPKGVPITGPDTLPPNFNRGE
jgi:hypothetical protein